MIKTGFEKKNLKKIIGESIKNGKIQKSAKFSKKEQ